MAENTFKKEVNKEPNKENKRVKNNIFSTIITFIGNILNGYFLTAKKLRKHLPFIFFMVLLAALNISNIISVERKHRQKLNIEKELSKLRAKHSFYSGQVAKNIKPSIITEKLKHRGIKEPNEPIIKIKK